MGKSLRPARNSGCRNPEQEPKTPTQERMLILALLLYTNLQHLRMRVLDGAR